MILSIVIPAFNEEKTIYKTIQIVCEECLKNYKDFEIIIVDDGSTDSTKNEIQKAERDFGKLYNIRSYFSPVNFGKGAGIRLGYMLAKGDIILIQDADLELSPKDYPLLIQPILDGKAKVVYGSRFLKQSENIRNRTTFGNWLVSFVLSLLYGIRVTDVYTGFKVMKSSVAKSLKLKSVGFEIEPEITIRLAKQKEKIMEVPVKYIPRKNGIKKIKYIKDGTKFFITAFRYRFFN